MSLKKVTASELGEWVNLQVDRIGKLANEGVTVKLDHGKYDLKASVAGYVKFLQRSKKNQWDVETGDRVESLDHVKERTRKMKADADLAELKVAEAKGKKHDSDAVRAVMNEQVFNAKARLLALSMKLSAQLTGIESQAQRKEICDELIYEALNELKEYDGSIFINKYFDDRKTVAH